ncbi:MAG: arsenic resistance N-acetyltransferase ArsN2 [Cyclobacteriaceae bacterium]|jgi:amino-acid N-acetyltransferase|nr:arsenic resistance N-acetyltransferase ArsN2 [Flammeovirgaceae bacterium]
MTRELTSFPISEDQLENFCDLLRECNLPYSDVKLAGNWFVGYTNEQGELMATGGLEFYGEYALLRSIAVRKKERGKNMGQRVVYDLVAKARDHQVQSLFLLTETAYDFFLNNGFREISRDQIPEAIRQSTQFASVCPSSAACLIMKLK